MSVSFTLPKKEYKNTIREVDLNGIKVGGQNALPFMHSESSNISRPIIVGEVLTNIPAGYPDMLKDRFGSDNPLENIEKMLNTGISSLAVRFNIENCEDIDYEIDRSKEQLQEILKLTELPLFIIGTFRRDIDIKLLTELSGVADRKCTIGAVEEENYKEIAPVIRDCGHNIIARTPIDINLTKQLNILLTEIGVDADKILIDPNTSGLGYGLDYAYSIIERIRIAALDGDNMLNMPILTFVGEEAWKTKESKAREVPEGWGSFEERALIWECMTTSSMIAAGSDIVVMRHPEAIKRIQKFIDESN